jgi:uncharacterized membrane protein
MRLSKIIVFFLIGTFIAHGVYYYPVLPDPMAVHFNGAGVPDAWAPKRDFFIFEALILALIVLEFTLLPWIIGKLPLSLINMPNKEYWFADERRGETIGMIARFFEWFAAALLALFIAVNQLVFRANLGGGNLSPNMWLILLAFFVFVAVWLVKFYRQFRMEKI